MPAQRTHGDVVLITGFEANDPPHRNTSAVLVEALAGQLTELQHACGCIEVRARLMRGDTTALAGSLEAALNEQPRPTHLLLLGQAPGRNRVTLERFATNLRDFGTSDRHGHLPRDVAVIDGGPAAYQSTWPEQKHLGSRDKVGDRNEIPEATRGEPLANQGIHSAAADYYLPFRAKP